MCWQTKHTRACWRQLTTKTETKQSVFICSWNVVGMRTIEAPQQLTERLTQPVCFCVFLDCNPGHHDSWTRPAWLGVQRNDLSSPLQQWTRRPVLQSSASVKTSCFYSARILGNQRLALGNVDQLDGNWHKWVENTSCLEQRWLFDYLV